MYKFRKHLYQHFGYLGSLWWDKNMYPEIKRRLGKTTIESLAFFGCEVWFLNKKITKEIPGSRNGLFKRVG